MTLSLDRQKITFDDSAISAAFRYFEDKSSNNLRQLVKKGSEDFFALYKTTEDATGLGF